jgi:hypothetical protein
MSLCAKHGGQGPSNDRCVCCYGQKGTWQTTGEAYDEMRLALDRPPSQKGINHLTNEEWSWVTGDRYPYN